MMCVKFITDDPELIVGHEDLLERCINYTTTKDDLTLLHSLMVKSMKKKINKSIVKEPETYLKKRTRDEEYNNS
jgi:hypothetical protein